MKMAVFPPLTYNQMRLFYIPIFFLLNFFKENRCVVQGLELDDFSYMKK